MAAIEKLDTHHKALTLNLDPSVFGSFAEIGAGQEVARWFLIVGAASGTVAKTISAYDKEVSDDLYGRGSRYVSRQRLDAMLDSEWTQLLKQLGTSRGSQTRFFSFVDTVSARNYAGTNEPHGWLGLRFQRQIGGQPNDILLHINLRDPTNLLQQEAIGILGVNLIYAAFHQLQTSEQLIESVAQDVESRIKIDYVDLRGPAFETWDRRTLMVHLVHGGFAEVVCFPSSSSPIPLTEVIHKSPVVLAPGYFVHVDRTHAEIHTQMLTSAIRQLQGESGEGKTTPRGFFCLTLTPPNAKDPLPEVPDLLRRIDALRSRGGDVLLFREGELYTMTDIVNRYTDEPVRFVVGLSLMIRAFEDRYSKLDGSFLTALSRLLAHNVRIYAYPMAAADLQKAVQSIPATDWQWDETDGWVSARQLRPPGPRRHLFAYVLDSNFLVPLQPR
ncbi:MAG TPA: hypothetical protein VMH03_13555 [Terriglobales bacterium]|nr:hypothetical protein [Terriglobales bacterium]